MKTLGDNSGKTNWLAGIMLLLLSACGELSEDSNQDQVVNATSVLETARTIHEQITVIDAHADIVISSTSLSYISDDGTSKVSPDKMRSGGVDAVVMSIAVGPGPRTDEADAEARAEADEKLAAIQSLLTEHGDSVELATTSEEILSINERGKAALILGFQNARSLQKNISALDEFYAAGVRIFGLNHLGHNDFSDSSRPAFDAETGAYEATAHGGLSVLGIAAIKRINALGAVVDVSQLSIAATLQTVDLSTAPVIASHSNVRAIADVTRNLSDEEIDRIGANGGVIHVAAFKAYLLNISDPEFISSLKSLRRNAGISEEYNYPYELYWEIDDPTARASFLSSASALLGPARVEHMLDHIDYIVKRIGIDHVGIGNDFNHGSGIDDYVDASESMNITIGLVERGYSSEEIQKIWGGNFMRVLDQAAQLRESR